MSSAVHVSSAPRTRSAQSTPVRLIGRVRSVAAPLELAGVFAQTALCHSLQILPLVSVELSRWRASAAAIPSPALRRSAEEALRKRGNVEGAALFATLAPPARRAASVRALVAFQVAYGYLDVLSERPSEDPIANSQQLHQALLLALRPDAPQPDYYARNGESEDGGYLAELVDVCRGALALLPSRRLVEPAARAAAGRIVDFQALNLSETQGGHGALARWASEATPAGSRLAWWEVAAAGGSSLAVLALIAAAARPELDREQVKRIEDAYFPWAGALHSLLDSFVDRAEDERSGRRSLLDYYDSSALAAIRLAELAGCARATGERLPTPHRHRVIVTAMCSYYLSAPDGSPGEAEALARRLANVLGGPLRAAIAMFRCRRLLHALGRRPFV